MKGTIELTPDQLANLVCSVLEMNGFKADGLSFHDQDGQLVGFTRAVVHCNVVDGLKVYAKPDGGDDPLNRILYPIERRTNFASRNGS